MLRQATREGLLQLADADSPLPASLARDVRASLRCGDLRQGFVRVRCDACADELLVAFSCKGRGFCPSCAARKASLVAAHLVDAVLPPVPYRQWTLSLPFPVRGAVLRHPRLLDVALKALLQRVAALHRRTARRLGAHGAFHAGAVSFEQRFGSRLQLTPHLHVLCPDGLFSVADDGAVGFLSLPPPTPEDVARVVASVARRVLREAQRLVDEGLLADVDFDSEDGVRLHALQESLAFPSSASSLAAVAPRPHHARVAVSSGFSLHADTWTPRPRQGRPRAALPLRSAGPARRGASLSPRTSSATSVASTRPPSSLVGRQNPSSLSLSAPDAFAPFARRPALPRARHSSASGPRRERVRGTRSTQ